MRRMTGRMMAWAVAAGLACLATGAWAKTWVLSVAVAGSMTPQDERELYVPSYNYVQELAGNAGFPKNRLPQPGMAGEDIDLHFYGLAVATDSALGGHLVMVPRHVSLDIQNASRKDIEVTRKPRQNSPFDTVAQEDLKRKTLGYLTETMMPEWDGLILVADFVEAKDFTSYDKKHRFIQVVHPVRQGGHVAGDRLFEDIHLAAHEFAEYVDSQCKVDVPVVRRLNEAQKVYPGQDVRFEVMATNAEKIVVAWDDGNTGTQAGGSRVGFKHAYKEAKTYDVVFKAVRGGKESAPCNKEVKVLPLPQKPIMVVSSEAPRLRVGEEKVLQIRCSGEDFTGTLDLGVFGGSQELQRGQNITLKYDIPGSYEILAEARNVGGTTKKRITVTVEAAEPVVELSGVSCDGLKVEVSYRVMYADSAKLSFGDGSGEMTVAAEGRKEYTYAAGGTYMVTLEAGSARRTVQVEVAEKTDPTPVVRLYGAEQGNNGAVTVSYQASNVSKAELQFGDGTPGEGVEGAGTRSHSYKNGGHYQIRLVAEKDGQPLEPKALDVDVEGPEVLPPVLDLYGLRADGLDVEVNTFVKDAERAELDFGDGSEPATVEAGDFLVTHHYAGDGDYTLTLSCAGGTPATKEVTVVAPVVEPLKVRVEVKDEDGNVLKANADGKVEARAGDTLQFVAVTTGDAGKIRWNYGMGQGTGSGRTPWHSFADAGEYTVKVKVEPAAVEGEDGEAEAPGEAVEGKVVVVVEGQPFPLVLLLVVLAVLGAGGWLVARAVMRCPKTIHVDGKKAGKFALLTNEAVLPENVTKVGKVTLKAGKRGIVSVKVSKPGMKARGGAGGGEMELREDSMESLRGLFGGAKTEYAQLTLTGPEGAKCEITLK